MIEIRRAADIHEEEGGWFRAHWHFSFSRYHDPDHTGLGALRVFNDDRLMPGAAWPLHPHRDLESNTYVVEGRFAHEDSLGNGGTLGPGGAQVMRFSSTGALHAERNASGTDPMRFIQFWILPSDDDLTSSVQQSAHTAEERADRWLQIMGPAGEGGLDLVQDARALVSRLTPAGVLSHGVHPGRGAYLYVIDGAVTLGDGETLTAGDAAAVDEPTELSLSTTDTTTDGTPDTAELILIDVPLDIEPAGVWARRSR